MRGRGIRIVKAQQALLCCHLHGLVAGLDLKREIQCHRSADSDRRRFGLGAAKPACLDSDLIRARIDLRKQKMSARVRLSGAGGLRVHIRSRDHASGNTAPLGSVTSPERALDVPLCACTKHGLTMVNIAKRMRLYFHVRIAPITALRLSCGVCLTGAREGKPQSPFRYT